MSDDLIYDLRTCASYNLDASDTQRVDDLTNRAADRIEALEARNRALEEALRLIVYGGGRQPDERWHCGDECAQWAQDTAKAALDD